MSRAQLDHVLLDVDFFNNPKIRAFKGKFGHISQLCLIDAYTAMSRATNAIIDGDCVIAILSDYQLKWDFWEHCLDKGLVKIEGQGYSNSRVIQDQEKLGKSQDKWRLANGKRKGDSEATTNLHPINTQSKQNTVNVHGCEVLNTEELNIDINLKELDTPEIKLWMGKTRARIKASGGNTDQLWVDALLMKYAGRPADLLAALKHTASLTKTKNVYEPEAKSSRGGAPPVITEIPQSNATTTRLLALAEQIEKEKEWKSSK